VVKTLTMFMMTLRHLRPQFIIPVKVSTSFYFTASCAEDLRCVRLRAHGNAFQVFTEGWEFLDHLTTTAFSRDPVHRGAICLGLW
jgi:hypothetical protein